MAIVGMSWCFDNDFDDHNCSTEYRAFQNHITTTADGISKIYFSNIKYVGTVLDRAFKAV